jgi:hypothetical protein
VLTRALLGHATTAVTCTVGGDPVMRGAAAIAALAKGLTLDWGLSELSPVDDSGSGPDYFATTVDREVGLASLTVGIRAVAGDRSTGSAGERAGWRYAHWLVSHAKEHGVKRVAFDGREWTARRGTWKRLPDSERSREQVQAEVHADI